MPEVGAAGLDAGAVTKPDRSPVTVADFGSQALVCRALGAAFPADPVIGEEDRRPAAPTAGRRHPDARGGTREGPAAEADTATVCAWIDRGNTKAPSARGWTLDPIDGTKGFLRGGQYAIALALILDGKLELAAMGCPSLGVRLDAARGAGVLFAALRGAGAWQMPLLARARRSPSVSSRQSDVTAFRFCESVEKSHSSHAATARIAARLRIAAAPTRLDSQAKYGVVARGEAEAYLRLPRDEIYREKIWDHAAGALVVTEAGGTGDRHRREEAGFLAGDRAGAQPRRGGHLWAGARCGHRRHRFAGPGGLNRYGQLRPMAGTMKMKSDRFTTPSPLKSERNL